MCRIARDTFLLFQKCFLPLIVLSVFIVLNRIIFFLKLLRLRLLLEFKFHFGDQKLNFLDKNQLIDNIENNFGGIKSYGEIHCIILWQKRTVIKLRFNFIHIYGLVE
jgi:hypothetical protein